MANKMTDRFADTPLQGSSPRKFLTAMRPLAGKWKIEILAVLTERTHRFGELKRALPGITQHVLSVQLRELEADGLVLRTAYPEKPPRVEYCTTEAVVGLEPVFAAVIAWAEKYGTPADDEFERVPFRVIMERRAGL